MRDLQLQLIHNRSTARRFKLLAIIEREQFVTIQYIATKLGASQRTILTDFHMLKEHFGKSAKFNSSNNGYHFSELDTTTYNQKKQTLLDKEPLYDIISNIFYGELDTLEDTAIYLNYSTGSLRRILQSAQPVLRQYGLAFQINPIKIIGDEIAIRKFFFDFYYEGAQTPHTLHPPKGFHSLFLQQLSDVENQIELDTGVGIASFYYRIYIAFERYRQGYRLVLPKKLEKVISQESDFSRLLSFINTLGETYGYALSKTEVIENHADILKVPFKYRAGVAAKLTAFSGLLSHSYTHPKIIYFILEGDALTRQSIIFKAKQLFEKDHHLTFLPIWHLSKEMFKKKHIDLIVTNYSPYITDYLVSYPYVLISDQPKAKDWQMICSRLGLDPSYFFV